MSGNVFLALSRKKKGFTFLELMILSILAVIFLVITFPKFVNSTTHTRDAANQGMAGSLYLTMTTAHAAWVAAGSPTSITNTIVMENVSIQVNANGWPNDGAPLGEMTFSNCINIVSDTAANAVMNNGLNVQPTRTACSQNKKHKHCYFVSSTTTDAMGNAFSGGNVCQYTLANTESTIIPNRISYNPSNGVVLISPQ